MKKVLLMGAIVTALFVGIAQARPRDGRDDVYRGAPEIDPNVALAGVTALVGGLTVLRHYRRRK